MSLYNIDTPHIHSYRCINVSECAMPWNICSLGMMWLGKTQAKAGGQPSLEAVPRLLREAAVWDSGWKEPSNQESPGRGGIQMHSFVTEYGIHRRKWLKAWEGMRWGNPEDPWDLVGHSQGQPSTPTASQLWFMSKIPTLHSLLYPYQHSYTRPYSGVEHTLKLAGKSTQKVTLCLKRAHETRQQVVSYSQPARRYW